MKKECGNSRITQENSEILKNEQHYQFARRLLTLTEIDAMILVILFYLHSFL